MNTSLLFKNAILNLYKAKIYTVDYAIIKASDYADKNKLTAEDYEELLTYLAEEQAKAMQPEEVEETEENIEENESTEVVEDTVETDETVENTVENVENTENTVENIEDTENTTNKEDNIVESKETVTEEE